jgi:hypothetical protein
VVTGGEPLEHAGIRELLAAAAGQWPRVEVETSGIAPPPITHERIAYMWSPKLPGVTDAGPRPGRTPPRSRPTRARGEARGRRGGDDDALRLVREADCHANACC